jgi:hypothetical protein
VTARVVAAIVRGPLYGLLSKTASQSECRIVLDITDMPLGGLALALGLET